MSLAQPNDGHIALARGERSGRIFHLITQNVDGLHHRAGSTKVVDLHGSIHEVVCLTCKTVVNRDAFQQTLIALNPDLAVETMQLSQSRPDGDVDISTATSFRVPACSCCGNGILKPNVVFFGANVEIEKKCFVSRLIEAADGLLVIGTSLPVLSSLSVAQKAAQQSLPIVIVCDGPTRGDYLATLKLSMRCTPFLTSLFP